MIGSQNMFYVHIPSKQSNVNTCYNIDTSQNAELNEQNLIEIYHIWYNSIHVKCPVYVNSHIQSEVVVTRAWEGRALRVCLMDT